ncbi:uncharacterized protein F4812DRAFT_401290 [Daldinia caldariorum]|uniref:uncharacterized protein n=1 Tax=Daldinia caldariorum TaxID=326644 RepID=UPI00200874CB|nr:uncharacterized protein F4812DRAFT_401290 [Daldinia caldariorum]KAI1467575.1 hypothetical protein F4812DRAFT_401290 [Daldinia caldariorum]
MALFLRAMLSSRPTTSADKHLWQTETLITYRRLPDKATVFATKCCGHTSLIDLFFWYSLISVCAMSQRTDQKKVASYPAKHRQF